MAQPAGPLHKKEDEIETDKNKKRKDAQNKITEAKELHLLKSKQKPRSESTFDQSWRIVDHLNDHHHFTTRQGYNDDATIIKGDDRTFKVGKKNLKASEIAGGANSGGYVVQDGQKETIDPSWYDWAK